MIRSNLQNWLSRPEIGAFLMLLVLVFLFELYPRFANGQAWTFVNMGNLSNLLSVLPELGLLVLGVTVLLIVREFDLSVGAVSAFTGVLMFEFMNSGNRLLTFGLGFAPALWLSLGIAMLIGWLNALVTLRLRIHSFVATLGMLFMVRSLAVVVTDGFPPATPAAAPLALASTSVLGLSVPLWVFVVIALVLSFILTRSNFGNWMYATGGDEMSSHCVGIDTQRVKTVAFMVSSTLAGLAGILVALRMATATPTAGDGAELEALAATVIGGASLQGGVGTVMGAVIGAAIIRLIDVGLIVARVDSNWFRFAVGALLIIAVVFNGQIRSAARRIRITAARKAQE